MNLSEAWVELDRERSRGAGLVTRRLESTAPCGLLAGTEYPSGARLLLMEVPAAAIGPEPWPRGRGFEVHPVLLSGGSQGSVQLQIRCADLAWSDVFGALTIDLVRRLERERTSASAVGALRQRLAIWQSFFQRQRPTGLTAEEQRGLFGELWLLHEALIAAWGPMQAVSAWQGPTGTAQDYVAHVAIEVKTSLTLAPTRILIANEHQLAAPPGVPLLLAHFVLSVHESADLSLPEVVERVVRTLAASEASALELFLERLQGAGYVAMEANEYLARYSVQAQAFYRVTEAFPRIVPSDLRHGVETVKYAIDTSSILPFRLAEDALSTLLGAK